METVTKLCARCSFKLPGNNKNRAHLCAECQRDLAYTKGRLSKKHRAWIKEGRPTINRLERFKQYPMLEEVATNKATIWENLDQPIAEKTEPGPKGYSDDHLLQCMLEFKLRLQKRAAALADLRSTLLSDQ